MTNETEMAPLVPAAATAEAADATPARAEEHRSPGRRVQQFLHVYPTTIPFLVLLLGVIGFAFIAGGRFFHPLNLSLILQQVTIIAMVGIAQTLVILTAGIDLSVGAMMVLSSVVVRRLAVLSGVQVPLAFAAWSVAAWILIGRIGAVSPNAGATANLDSITAAVIGGTSLFGGRGSITGTLFGALIVGVFRNGLALAGLQNTWQELTVGLLIIVAVALDQWIRRLAT